MGPGVCRKSKWKPPIHTIGWQKAAIALATDSEEDETESIMAQLFGSVYYIGDIEKYHKGEVEEIEPDNLVPEESLVDVIAEKAASDSEEPPVNPDAGESPPNPDSEEPPVNPDSDEPSTNPDSDEPSGNPDSENNSPDTDPGEPSPDLNPDESDTTTD